MPGPAVGHVCLRHLEYSGSAPVLCPRSRRREALLLRQRATALPFRLGTQGAVAVARVLAEHPLPCASGLSLPGFRARSQEHLGKLPEAAAWSFHVG